MEPSTTDRRTVLRLLGVAAGLGATASVPATASASGASSHGGTWAMWGGDPGGSSHLADTEPPTQNLTAEWSVETGMSSPTPVVGDGTVYAVGDGGMVAIESGEVAWENTDGEYRLPAYHDGVVVATSRSAAVAVNADTGETVWSYELPGSGGVVRPHDGTVYVLAAGESLDADGQLAAVDAASGEVQWEQSVPPTQAGFPMSLVVDGERAVVTHSTDSGGLLAAYSLADGTQQWEYAFDGSTPFGSVAVDGTVYAVTGQRLLGIAAADGSEQFAHEYTEQQPFPLLFVVADGEVLVPSQDGGLLAHDAATGDPAWSSEETEWAQLVTAAGDYVFSGREGTVYVYDRTGPEPVGSLDTGADQALVVPAAEALYVSEDTGTISALVEGEGQSDDGSGDDGSGDDGSDDGSSDDGSSDDGSDDSTDGGSDDGSGDGSDSGSDDGSSDDGGDDSTDGSGNESDGSSEDDTGGNESTGDSGSSDGGSGDGESDDGGGGNSIPGFGAVATLAGVGSVAGWLARRTADEDDRS